MLDTTPPPPANCKCKTLNQSKSPTVNFHPQPNKFTHHYHNCTTAVQGWRDFRHRRSKRAWSARQHWFGLRSSGQQRPVHRCLACLVHSEQPQNCAPENNNNNVTEHGQRLCDGLGRGNSRHPERLQLLGGVHRHTRRRDTGNVRVGRQIAKFLQNHKVAQCHAHGHRILH